MKNHAVFRIPDPTTDQTNVQAGSSAPDWDHVPFDVGCARCGHDLRGRIDPICPACGLTFDWTDAVPIERLICAHCDYHLYGLQDMRCPECGIAFTWEEALAEYHRRRQPWFEFRWRDRPIRSLLTTWRGAMWPGTFWRSIDIHSPPHIGRLLAQVAISLAIVILGVPVWLGLLEWVSTVFLNVLGMGVATMISSIAELPMIVFGFAVLPEVYGWGLALGGTWLTASLLALLVFQQSMRRAKVRFPQVLRAWSGSVLVPLLLALPTATVIVAYVLLDVYFGIGRESQSFLPWFGVLPLGHAVWSLRQSYKFYLRLPHALAVALCSQGIAILATFTLLVVANLLLHPF
ncbi:MAG: hypothetical protein IH989_07740 [Planctomycetes bacterium]|nr:hypothetical protein [Planctomycetota bacterium]